MRITFSTDARSSGDAEATVLAKLVGFSFLVKRGSTTFRAELVEVDVPANLARFVTFDDNETEVAAAIDTITELVYL